LSSAGTFIADAKWMQGTGANNTDLGISIVILR